MTSLETECHVAETIARLAHHGQFDKQGEPYIHHVVRVAVAVAPEYQPAAWLHDVLEDCVWVTREHLDDAGVSRETLRAVDLLTRDTGESYNDYIGRIADSRDPIALAVKLADLHDHLDRDDCPDRLRPRYVAALRRLQG